MTIEEVVAAIDAVVNEIDSDVDELEFMEALCEVAAAWRDRRSELQDQDQDD